jgi:hypothetical protein
VWYGTLLVLITYAIFARVVSFREGLTNARKDHTMNINEISPRLWLAQILHNCEWQLQASLLSAIL